MHKAEVRYCKHKILHGVLSFLTLPLDNIDDQNKGHQVHTSTDEERQILVPCQTSYLEDQSIVPNTNREPASTSIYSRDRII